MIQDGMSTSTTCVRIVTLAAAVLAAGLLQPRPTQADELYEYGEYLSGECTTCHQRSGASSGIPSITGWPVDAFVIVLKSYRDGAKENEAMRNVAQGLSDEDMMALARYFHQQGKRE